MAGRVEYVLDFGCGTATSASLYYLLYYPSSIVIGIDRDCNREWVESHLPEPVRRRFFFVPGDVGKLTIWKVEEHVERHMKIPLSRLTRVHWSPCCRGLSDASRGFHRDSMGNPLTDLARRDDAIFGILADRALRRGIDHMPIPPCFILMLQACKTRSRGPLHSTR